MADAPGMKRTALFSFIEAQQGETPFGQVLDAGTGPRSLAWVMTLNTDSWTAVTGAPAMAAQLQGLVGERQRPQDRLLLGNWADPELLAGEQFDTVLADHLLGAIEGFAPYFQPALFGRLRSLTAKRLYVTGMQPYVIERPVGEAGLLIWQIGRYRDACLMLAAGRPYREYPLNWVLAELRRSGFQPVATRKLKARYRGEFVNNQIDLCRPALTRMADQALSRALIAHGEALRTRALAHIESHGSLSHGYHYSVAADPI